MTNKVERLTTMAFVEGRHASVGNTDVHASYDLKGRLVLVKYKLHGRVIGRWEAALPSFLTVRDGGVRMDITRRRINALLEAVGSRWEVVSPTGRKWWLRDKYASAAIIEWGGEHAVPCHPPGRDRAEAIRNAGGRWV